MTQNVQFIVSLSNGETIYEGKGDYTRLAGQPSPWMRLMHYIAVNKLTITSLNLYTPDGHVHKLPSIGNNPKFRAFTDVIKPIKYNFKRIIAKDIVPNAQEEIFVVIEAIYLDYVLSIWVSDNNPKQSWTLLVNKKGGE